MPTSMTPAQAWAALMEGNQRFVRGEMTHPAQDAARRAAVAEAQNPFAVVFGCSDSRVSAEIVFDRGLGDLFVVRTAGHVTGPTVIESIEYGVQVLGAPLVVVLGHDSCGAVRAAARALATGSIPEGFVRTIVDRIASSLEPAPHAGPDLEPSITSTGQPLTPEQLSREPIWHTSRMLVDESAAVRAAVAAGRCAVVGATYPLAEGRVRRVAAIGRIE